MIAALAASSFDRKSPRRTIFSKASSAAFSIVIADALKISPPIDSFLSPFVKIIFILLIISYDLIPTTYFRNDATGTLWVPHSGV